MWEKLGTGRGLTLLGFATLAAFTSVVLVRPAVDPEALGWGFALILSPIFGGGAVSAYRDWKSNGSAPNGGSK